MSGVLTSTVVKFLRTSTGSFLPTVVRAPVVTSLTFTGTIILEETCSLYSHRPLDTMTPGMVIGVSTTKLIVTQTTEVLSPTVSFTTQTNT